MLTRYIAPLVLLITLAACKNDLQLAEDAIRKDINDNAFKRNKKHTIYELKVFNVTPINESSIHVRKLAYLSNMVTYYSNLYGLQVNYAGTATDQMKLYASMDMMDIAEMKREDARDRLSEAKKIEDTMFTYKAMYDSLEKKKVDTAAKNYYEIQAFLKATIDDQNILDTFYYIADKKWQLIDPLKDVIIY